MRSRTVREGSVGLLILLGVGVLTGLLLWIRGFNPSNRSYRAVIQFPAVAGIQVGAFVTYRGVSVGRVVDIRPGANAVEVEIEIAPGTLVIPKNAVIEANQGGLIGATTVDITPRSTLSSEALAQNPLSPQCRGELVVCNGDRLSGEVGVSFNELVRSTTQFADVFSNPQFFAEVRSLTRNSAEAAAGVSQLTGEVTKLTRSVQSELNGLSTAAANSATSVGAAATQLGLTAAQVNGLLRENRSSLVSTLSTIDQTSRQVQGLVSTLSPQIENGRILQNLETLSDNAAAASANLRSLTDDVGRPETMLMLQQTLDSARATFQNAQKITSDLDELTGDPQLRQNIRDLINGFGNLVSSSRQLQQQAALAQALMPITASPAASAAPAMSTRSMSEATGIALNPAAANPLSGSESQAGGVPSAGQSKSRLQLPTDAEYREWLKTFAVETSQSPTRSESSHSTAQ
ncbi:MAG TPA: MlaD family protein [Coleofasciculaceae cyanobacterium]